MNELEREEFKNTVKNFDEEERSILVRTLPNELLIRELERRLYLFSDKFTQIRDILKVQEVE